MDDLQAHGFFAWGHAGTNFKYNRIKPFNQKEADHYQSLADSSGPAENQGKDNVNNNSEAQIDQPGQTA